MNVKLVLIGIILKTHFSNTHEDKSYTEIIKSSLFRISGQVCVTLFLSEKTVIWFVWQILIYCTLCKYCVIIKLLFNHQMKQDDVAIVQTTPVVNAASIDGAHVVVR